MSVFLHTGANSWLAQSLPVPYKVHSLHTHQWVRLQHRTGNSYHYTLYPELCVQEIHNTGTSCSLGTKKVILRRKKKRKKKVLFIYRRQSTIFVDFRVFFFQMSRKTTTWCTSRNICWIKTTTTDRFWWQLHTLWKGLEEQQSHQTALDSHTYCCTHSLFGNSHPKAALSANSLENI